MIVRPYEYGDEMHVANSREFMVVADQSWAWTVEDNDIILAVVGCSQFMAGTGHLWAQISEDIRGKGFSFTKKMRKMIEITIARQEYKRIQAFALSDNEENGRWLKVLGMKKESTMIAAYGGRDMDVYARII